MHHVQRIWKILRNVIFNPFIFLNSKIENFVLQCPEFIARFDSDISKIRPLALFS